MTATEREQVISNLEAARHELLAAIEGLSDDQLSQAGCLGDWAAKDVLSHLASWDEFCARDFGRMARSDMPALAAFKEERVNDYNDAFMALRLHFPAAQACRELDENRSQVLAAVRSLPDALFAPGQLARIVMDVQVGHDRDHAGHIRAWRTTEGL